MLMHEWQTSVLDKLIDWFTKPENKLGYNHQTNQCSFYVNTNTRCVVGVLLQKDVAQMLQELLDYVANQTPVIPVTNIKDLPNFLKDLVENEVISEEYKAKALVLMKDIDNLLLETAKEECLNFLATLQQKHDAIANVCISYKSKLSNALLSNALKEEKEKLKNS